MKILELFSGTHSIGKVFKPAGFDVLSLDLQGADINIDILKWNYKEYPQNYFDVIWASPPCVTFSALRFSHIGRRLKKFDNKIVTKEMLEKDMIDIGLPILRKTQEIINYFNPQYWFIENPQTGRMKKFMNNIFYYDVEYCQYGFDYKKPTRIWTNLENFNNKRCNKECSKKIPGTNKHITNIQGYSTNMKYRIPEPLIKEILKTITKNNIENFLKIK